MLALPLRLPTAPYGGHMGHFLLSMLMLSGSAPFGNMASLSVELNSKYLVQGTGLTNFMKTSYLHSAWVCGHLRSQMDFNANSIQNRVLHTT